MTILGAAARTSLAYVEAFLGGPVAPHDPDAAPQLVVLDLPCPGGVDTDQHLAEWTMFAGIHSGSANKIKCEACGFK